MATSSITNYINQQTANSPAASSSSSTSKSSQSSLGENDFLTLLITQLKNQDPSNPQDSSAFVAELAQFSSLQQETNVNQNIQQTAATGMIGLDVTDNAGNTGVVTGVTIPSSNSTTGLQLNVTTSAGKFITIDYSNITQVNYPSSTSSTSSTSS